MNFVDKLASVRAASEQKCNVRTVRTQSFRHTNLGSRRTKPVTGDSVEKYSKLELSVQYLDPDTLDLWLENCRVYSLARFLATVCPPDFKAPTDPNYVLFGIVSRKSEVRQAQNGNKYVSLQLCDLQYEVPLTVLGAAFDKYYKIQPGTVIAIMNPSCYAQRGQGHSLGLSVKGSGSPIIEIGVAKHLGQCSGESVASKKQCKNWVDLRKTQVCEYHQELRVHKAMSKRPEFNSVVSKLSNPRQGNRRLNVIKGGEVKWKRGLQIDNMAPYESVYQSGPQFEGEKDYDHALPTPQEKQRQERKKIDRLKAEVSMRKALAKRPDGAMLREYDCKGNLKNPELYDDTQHKAPDDYAFKPEHVRRLGFNPMRHKRQKIAIQNAKTQAARSALSDSDDELEIV